MECPHCGEKIQHTSRLTCLNCGKAYLRRSLEEYEHLKYLIDWLDKHGPQIGANAGDLRTEVNTHYQHIRQELNLEPIRDITPPIQTESAKEIPALHRAAVQIPKLTGNTALKPELKAPVPTAPARKPPAPPPPPRPPINWNKAWDNAVNFVVSGALLRALLYMGAFMIVVSAFVLVINFWDIFPPILQLTFIFSLPTIFYAAGWLVRTRIKLQQAGLIITGIGAVLLAVDFTALYQLGKLGVDVNLYWLAASVITTIIYTFTAIRIKIDFFSYLALISSTNILLALSRVLHAPLEWTIAMLPLSGLGMVGLSASLWPQGETWRAAARAARYLPQVLVPLSLAAILFVGGPHTQDGKAAAFFFSAITYGLLAWKFPAQHQFYLALGSLAAAIWFAVSNYLWQPAALALLSAVYIISGESLFEEHDPPGKSRVYRQTFYWSGHLLALLSTILSVLLVIGGNQTAAAISLTVVALSYCTWNLILHKPVLGYAGSALLVFALLVWLEKIDRPLSFLIFTLVVGLAFLPAGIMSRRIDKKLAAPFERTGWAVSAILTLIVVSSNNPFLNWVNCLTLTLLNAYYVFNAWYYRNWIFAWATAAIFPLAMIWWLILRKVPIELNHVSLAVLAYAYLFLERYFHERKADLRFRIPLGVGSGVLAFVALEVSLLSYQGSSTVPPGYAIHLVNLGLVVGLSILAARLYHSFWPLFIEPVLAALFAAFFFIKYSPAILGKEMIWHQYGLVFGVLGWVHLAAAAILDQRPMRYAYGLYLGGYGLLALSILVGAINLFSSFWGLTLFVSAMTVSALLVHYKRHQTWQDFTKLWGGPSTKTSRVVRTAFLFAAVYFFPVWLTQLEAIIHLTVAWRGFSLTLLAPLYIASGLFLKRTNHDYTWPFYSAGCALTVIGALMAIDSEAALILSLAVNVATYAASAFIFSQSFWLYLAALLTPVTTLLFLDYTAHLTEPWIAWSFTGLAFLYFSLGQMLERLKIKHSAGKHFTRPMYQTGYLLSIVALAVAYYLPSLAIIIYPANMLLYAISAWRFKEALFLYPAVWLSVVPYNYSILQTLKISPEWLNLAWFPLTLILVGLGRSVFHKRPLNLISQKGLFNSLAHPAMPFYILAYALTLVPMFGPGLTPLSLTVTYTIMSVFYFSSALLFRHPTWLYPTLISIHLAILAYFTIHPSETPLRYISIPFLGLSWLEALAGYFMGSRHKPALTNAEKQEDNIFSGRKWNWKAQTSIRHLTTPSWAQPLFLLVVLDTLGAGVLALSGQDTGVWVSAGFFLLYALFVFLWKDQLLAYISLGSGILAVGYELRSLGLTLLQTFAGLSGLSLALYLLSWLIDRLKGVLLIWLRPLVHAAIALSAISLFFTLGTTFSETISTAIALGFSGAIYLTMSLRIHNYRLGYLGVGMLIASWSLFLFIRNIAQPQFYAIPAGLYFTGLGFFERRLRPGRFSLMIESLGLAVLLVTSFAQSLNGEAGFPYFLLLLAEGLLVVWWGAARRLRVPFIIGLIASVSNVLAQIIVLVRVYDVNRWIILFGVGVLLVGLGIFVERRREILLARAQEFREMLETWE